MKKTAQIVDPSKWPDNFQEYQKAHNDKLVWLARKAVIDDRKNRGKWGLATSDGKFLSSDDDVDDEEKLKSVIIRAGEAAKRARRSSCHELAESILNRLRKNKINARRIFIDKDRYNGVAMGHSTVFFQGDDEHWHRAANGIGSRKKSRLGDFDSLEDAIDQYIAVEKANKQTTDDDRVDAYDTTDLPFTDKMPWPDYKALARTGKRIYHQEKKAGARDFSGLLKLADNTHTVSRNETLSAIARKYNTSIEALAKLNNIQDVNRLSVGQVLRLPGSAPETTYRMVRDSHLPKSQYVADNSGNKTVVTYPQGTYSLPKDIEPAFLTNLVSQLALEGGPHATKDQLQALVDVAVNQGSGDPGLIGKSLSKSTWSSRPKGGGWGRPEMMKRFGYGNTVKTLMDMITTMARTGTKTKSDHTMFRHTAAGKDSALPKSYATYPSSLTATNQFDSVKGPHLVTYRNDTYRHSHPEKQ